MRNKTFIGLMLSLVISMVAIQSCKDNSSSPSTSSNTDNTSNTENSSSSDNASSPRLYNAPEQHKKMNDVKTKPRTQARDVICIGRGGMCVKLKGICFGIVGKTDAL